MRKIIFFILLPFFFIAGCMRSKYPTSCDQVLKDYNELINEAKDEKKTKEIVDYLNHFINKNPNCINSYLLIGDIYFALNYYDSAKKKFLKVIHINPNNVYALFKIGLLYQLNKDYDSAVVYFTSAADIKAVDGFVINKTKNFEVITGTPDFDVDYNEIIFNCGIANYYTNHLSKSMDDLGYCISHNNNLKETYFFRGLIYIRIKDIAKGCEDMNSAKLNGKVEASEYIEKYCNNKGNVSK